MAPVIAAWAGGGLLLGALGAVSTYWEHRRYIDRTFFDAPLLLVADAPDGSGRHRRREGLMEPEVFQIEQPDRPGNSGMGYEDPEYAAMKDGQELAHQERRRGGHGPQDYVWLKAYHSHRYGTPRIGLITYIGGEHTVRSFLTDLAAWDAYVEAREQMWER